MLQFQEAADLYRKVLQSVDEHARAGHFRTNVLQTLHAVANLHELLSVHGRKITGREHTDDGLPQRVFSIPRLLCNLLLSQWWMVLALKSAHDQAKKLNLTE